MGGSLTRWLSDPRANPDEPREGALSDSDLAFYRKHGFVIARGLLAPSAADALLAAQDALITDKARALLDRGLLASLHEDKGHERRLAALLEDLPREHHAELTKGLDIYQARLPEVFEFFFQERLLNAAASLLGDELTLSPIQHLRTFLPAAVSPSDGVGAEWHMDQATALDEADEAEIVTCWIPLCDVSEANGCLKVLANFSRDEDWRLDRDSRLVIGHHASEDAFVEASSDGSFDVVDCEMRRGDVLLFGTRLSATHRPG